MLETGGLELTSGADDTADEAEDADGLEDTEELFDKVDEEDRAGGLDKLELAEDKADDPEPEITSEGLESEDKFPEDTAELEKLLVSACT